MERLRQPLDMSNDLDVDSRHGYTDLEILDIGRAMDQSETPQLLGKKTPLRYGIIASCLFHVAFFAALFHVVDRGPLRAVLAPGEQVTPVRLVEFQEPKTSPQAPPEKASAISDRNRNAERERMPRSLPLGTIGKVFGPEKMMAALSPPRAPEDLVKPEEPLAESQETEAEPAPPKEEPRKRPTPERAKEKTTSHRKADPEHFSARPNEQIDLRPTLEETRRAIAGSGGSLFGDPNGDPDELVVDINTREDKLFSYLLGLKQKIEGVWIYPPMAGRNGIGGMLTVEFVIAKDGKLLGVRQLDSSGHKLLDVYAMRAVKNAAPYYPFPERLHVKRLRIRAQFIYATASFFRRIL